MLPAGICPNLMLNIGFVRKAYSYNYVFIPSAAHRDPQQPIVLVVKPHSPGTWRPPPPCLGQIGVERGHPRSRWWSAARWQTLGAMGTGRDGGVFVCNPFPPPAKCEKIQKCLGKSAKIEPSGAHCYFRTGIAISPQRSISRLLICGDQTTNWW